MPTISANKLGTLKIAKQYHHTVKSRLAVVIYARARASPPGRRRHHPPHLPQS